jgi:hypothetical protein
MRIKKKIIRNTEKPIQKYRFMVQSAFALLCIWIGVEFYLFSKYLETGGASSFISRPPGVDGFLPISSFMSFYLFITTGEIHYAHPAGLFIFMAILLVSLVFGKAFCSWLVTSVKKCTKKYSKGGYIFLDGLIIRFAASNTCCLVFFFTPYSFSCHPWRCKLFLTVPTIL